MLFKRFTIIFISILFQSLKSSSQVLNFTYNGFHTFSDISTQGITAVIPNDLLRLTNTTVQKAGHAFYSKSIRFKDSPNGTVSSFSTTFVFAIYPHIPTLSGHGIAFVIAPLTQASHTQRQANTWVSSTSLATVMTQIITEFNDTNNNHVGIDINSLTSVQSSPAGWWDKKGQFKNLTLTSCKPMQVWVDYDGRTHKIDVTMALFNEDKPKKPLVSIVRDLSSLILQDIISDFFKFGLPLISLFLIVSLIFLVCFMVRRRRKLAEELDDWETEFGKNRLRFKDLYYATKGFKEKDLLGSGGFGRLYKGVMPGTKLEIAVKRVPHESRQGLIEFVSEIVSIGRMSHPNLVPLLGYCRRRGELLLVYDYMPNGRLDKYLYNTPEVTLDWKQRIKVILGVASGLIYLHEEWEQVVIHIDVKASNILLDEELNGRIGDFGLSRFYDHGTDPQTTDVVGTLGNLAPEHTQTGRATTATDVYAFGAFLLEVVCGRRPIEIQHESNGTFLLMDWVFWVMEHGKHLRC
ncbi:unnamed protein product, partial [Thlaspi arvense]